jgi:hypothetical protein
MNWLKYQQQQKSLVLLQVIDIVIIPISKPLLIGLYRNNELFEVIESEEMTSDFLPNFFNDILKKYEVKNIIYANGPGSYMAIKLTYIFLKTLQITKNINILSQDGFYFNQNLPIKAIGNRYFIKENDTITIKSSDVVGKFELPKVLNYSDFSDDIEPVYILNAV